MKVEIQIYGYVMVNDDMEIEKYYFATEKSREQSLQLDIADNPDAEFYLFNDIREVEV